MRQDDLPGTVTKGIKAEIEEFWSIVENGAERNVERWRTIRLFGRSITVIKKGWTHKDETLIEGFYGRVKSRRNEHNIERFGMIVEVAHIKRREVVPCTHFGDLCLYAFQPGRWYR